MRILSARMYHADPNPLEMWIGFGAAGLLCIACTLVPIRVALGRLSAVER